MGERKPIANSGLIISSTTFNKRKIGNKERKKNRYVFVG